jgi:DNA-directed RNA polymerase specialized sigma24 family protein
LRDVLGFRAKDVASKLDSTNEAVTSAVKHARANLKTRVPSPGGAASSSELPG